jgi:hypothetical protein
MAQRNLIIIILFSIICALMLIRECESSVEVTKTNIDSIEAKIKGDLRVIDSLMDDRLKKDSVRTVEVIKWRYIKQNHDTLPCDTFVKLVIAQCDTVIYRDSVLINSQQTIISKQDTVIHNQQTVIKSDSVEIVGLNKEVRKQKRLKRVFQVTTVGALLLAVFK